MKNLFKWFRIFAQLVLGTVVIGIIINLLTEEILSDPEGWVHAITQSNLVPWIIAILLAMTLIEILANKRTAKIEIQVKEVRFGGGGWANDMPLLPLKFQVFLDIRNKGNVSAHINFLEIDDVDLGTDLIAISSKPISYHLTSSSGAGRKIDWPFEIEATTRIPNIRGDIIVDLVEKNSANFASRLDELEKYSLNLKYKWEGVDGSTKVKKLPIEGTFDAFKNHLVKEWKEKGFHELVYSAKGL